MREKRSMDLQASNEIPVIIKGFKIVFIIVLMLMVSADVTARQITLLENFEDQNLHENPQWTGDLDDFSFVEEFENILLRLDAESTPNRSQIRTTSTTAYGSWEFYVRVPATSLQNRVYLYLLSDDEELDIVGSSSPGIANGYAVHTGSGRFDLVKIENGTQTETLLSSFTEIANNTGYQVKVTRDLSGEWEIYVNEGYGSVPELDSESAIDQTFTESAFFGIYVRYSAANVQGYFFDNVVVKGVENGDESDPDEPDNGDEENGGESDGEDAGDDGNGNNEEDDSESDEEGESGDGPGDSDEGDEENGGEGDDDAGDEETDDSDGEEEDDNGTGDDGDSEGEDSDGEDEGESGDGAGESDEGDDSDDESGDPGDGDDNGDSTDDDDMNESDDSENGDDGTDGGESEDNEGAGDEGTESAGPVINPGELLISEFYYRVPISWRTDEFDRPQYVELLNRSDNRLNLRNLSISGENISIDKDLIIEPGEYLVITRGMPVFEHRFGTRNFVEADQFPRFNLTTSGTITLENALGDILEELTFTASEWGGNGVSLERRSFDLDAALRGNWGESIDALTGSPGLPNTISVPTTAPFAESISVVEPRTVSVSFSAVLDEEIAGELSNYSLNQGITISSVEFESGGSVLILKTEEKLQHLMEYRLTYQNIEDIFGNRLSGVQELNFTHENPLTIRTVNFQDDQTIEVQFTMPVNLSKVDDARFRLSNGSSPVGIHFTNSESVLLSFGVDFTAGSYLLIVDNIEGFDPDLTEQWVIEPNSLFPFYKFDEHVKGDIVINEFMVRPPDRHPRYVELYNRSGRYLNMKEWQLRRRAGSTNNGGTISNLDLPFGPGEFMVITTDIDQMEAMFGTGPWVEMAGYPGFTQTTPDQVRIITPDGMVEESVEYSPSTWGGDGVALERRSISVPIIHPANWGESEATLLGTPGKPNSIGPMLVPPKWVDISVRDNKTIVIRFDGAPDEKSITTDKFTIDGGLSVIEVSFDEIRSVELKLDSPMISGQAYTLSTQGISDIFGNVMNRHERSLIYYHIEPANPGDVVINEFMYNEPDDYSRYIELFNRSEKVIDLSGWRQANNTGTRRILTEESRLLHPGTYIVITPDENLLHLFPDMPILNVGNRLSALKNGGDSIIIENGDHIVIDSLSYTTDWGGSGVSLERKSVEIPALYRENWSESTSQLLGTPGAENSVSADTDPPEVVSVKQHDNFGFMIEFSKKPDPATVTDLRNYRFDPNVILSAAVADKNRVLLMVESALINGRTYSITIRDIADIFGNVIENTEVRVHYLEFSDAGLSDIVINEILYRREQAGSPEFVELFNRTELNFDLSGWSLSNSTGSVQIPPGILLPAEEYLVLTDSGTLASQSDNIIQLTGFRSLNNNSDIVKVSNASGVTIDSLRYQSSWQNNPAGVSLERRDPAALSIDPNNWLKSSDPAGSTPGLVNSRFEIDDNPPEIIFVNLFHPDSLEVIFNKFIDLHNSFSSPGISAAIRYHSEATDSDLPTFSVNGEVVPILFYTPEEGQRVVIGPGDSITDDEIILTVDHLSDFSGNQALRLSQPVARPLSPGDLIFNEIMYHPISDNRNGLPDQSEYIEIYNRRPYAISLEGIFFHDRTDGSGNINVMEPATTARKWISSHAYLLVYPEINNVNFDDSRVANFFNLEEDQTVTPLRVARNTLNLTNTGRLIFLADSTGSVIDRVDYSPDWHNPNLIDTRGISLERINPDTDKNDGSNWSSSANITGGTPGKKNSIYQVPEMMSGENGVFLDPNPFSPNGSGFQDHLFISYKFDEPDYLIRIRIFDRYGRLVRNLVHGEPAGFEGSYIWDGRTDQGQTNRIGIYIVLVDAYNSSAGRNLQFKETAVIARQF